VSRRRGYISPRKVTELPLAPVSKRAEYAVRHRGEWHIGQWDGECFCVTSSLQSGDRYFPWMVERFVELT
jgi:hypothetical protein